MFIDVSGTHEAFVVPTGRLRSELVVYASMIYPALTPEVRINPGVKKYLLNGADLMWPGVANPLELIHIQQGDTVCVTEADEVIATGILMAPYSSTKKGKAVAIWNIIGDRLWALGSRKVCAPKLIQEDKKEEETVKGEKENETPLKEEEEEKVQESGRWSQEGEEGEEREEGEEGEEEMKDEEEGNDSHSGDETEGSLISPSQMDGFIMNAALNSFKLSLKPGSGVLPLEPSAFKSQHLAICSTNQLTFGNLPLRN